MALRDRTCVFRAARANPEMGSPYAHWLGKSCFIDQFAILRGHVGAARHRIGSELQLKSDSAPFQHPNGCRALEAQLSMVSMTAFRLP